ncbi:hypothetical protein BU25DRAFT_419090 [Macroventuria anomochaeta]|uniref:Uncharacterized protein n=1 Tax=Macroventuria anomochaeta TaxID=301207 RepID=A0ACB6S968_9PLEO|nr:uncharacterized protein BU25DRAFT_419090 [Macroventuria anomochaeta]KAF2630751.1 hypothetical protein BU25DRAFT_419090 [Macroventuria anomochaeta]
MDGDDGWKRRPSTPFRIINLRQADRSVTWRCSSSIRSHRQRPWPAVWRQPACSTPQHPHFSLVGCLGQVGRSACWPEDQPAAGSITRSTCYGEPRGQSTLQAFSRTDALGNPRGGSASSCPEVCMTVELKRKCRGQSDAAKDAPPQLDMRLANAFGCCKKNAGCAMISVGNGEWARNYVAVAHGELWFRERGQGGAGDTVVKVTSRGPGVRIACCCVEACIFIRTELTHVQTTGQLNTKKHLGEPQPNPTASGTLASAPAVCAAREKRKGQSHSAASI